MSTSPMSPMGGTLGLHERLDRVQRELAAQRRRTDTSTGLILVVGLIIIIGFGAFAWYGYQRIAGLVNEPKTMVDALAVTVQSQLPEMRRELVSRVRMQAPQVAAQLSEEGRRHFAQMREQFEDYAMSRIQDAMIDHKPFEDHFQTFLQQNKVQLRKAIKELDTNKRAELEPATMRELEQAMEANLGPNFSEQCRQALEALYAAKAKLDRLKVGKDLSPDEQMERRLLMIARRLRAQAENPQSIGMALPSDVKEEVIMRMYARKPGSGSAATPATATNVAPRTQAPKGTTGRRP